MGLERRVFFVLLAIITVRAVFFNGGGGGAVISAAVQGDPVGDVDAPDAGGSGAENATDAGEGDAPSERNAPKVAQGGQPPDKENFSWKNKTPSWNVSGLSAA